MPPTLLFCSESVDAKIRRARHHLSVLTADLMEVGRNYRPEMILKHDGPNVWLVVYHKSPYVDLSHSPWQIAVPMPANEIRPSHPIDARGTADFLIRTDAAWRDRPILDVAHTCISYVEDHVIREFKPLFE